jgi:hypothetical protein
LPARREQLAHQLEESPLQRERVARQRWVGRQAWMARLPQLALTEAGHSQAKAQSAALPASRRQARQAEQLQLLALLQLAGQAALPRPDLPEV